MQQSQEKEKQIHRVQARVVKAVGSSYFVPFDISVDNSYQEILSAIFILLQK